MTAKRSSTAFDSGSGTNDSTDLADTLVNRLKPHGVIVIVKARHLCISMRGVRKEMSEVVTSAQRGYLRKQITRLEAFHLING